MFSWYREAIAQVNTQELAKNINNPYSVSPGPLETAEQEKPIDDQYSVSESPLEVAQKQKPSNHLFMTLNQQLGKARTNATPLGVDEDGDGILDQPPTNMNSQYPETVRQDKKGPTQDMMPNTLTHWHNS